MKRVIRKDVWESNSSSVHSLQISSDGMEPSRLPVDKYGYIEADFGIFDSDTGFFDDQFSKLSFILTELYYLNGWNINIKENYRYKYIEDAICEYTGCLGIHILNNVVPELNHQIVPEYDFSYINIYNKKSIINFIFNRYIGLEIHSD